MKKFIKVIVLAMAFILVFATLASCGKSIDKIQKKAEDAGYKVNTQTVGSISVLLIRDEDNGTAAQVTEYEDAKTAKEAFDAAKELMDAAKDLAETAGVEYKQDVKRSGKVIISGDADIIKKVW